MAGAILSCMAGSARADGEAASGTAALSNGAIVEWRIESGGDGPTLGLSVPAFAQWTRTAFDTPATIAMRSDGLGVVDAWRLAFYRKGDTEFVRPLRRFGGDARSLGVPVEWDGRVEAGPPLRPGETVVARFETRDIAGNIDRAAPQEMLVSRYTMRAERRSIADIAKARTLMLAEGEAPVPGGIPVPGSVLVLTVTDWLDDEGPRASGLRFHRRSKAWTLRQTLPPGRHDVVIGAVRPIMGGERVIPVGALAVVSPAALPFHARVKGTGRMARTSVTGEALVSDTFLPEAMVAGRDAISRPMTHRESNRDRLALALIDANAPVTLSSDMRGHMAFMATYDGATAAWPGGLPMPGSGREPDDPPVRPVDATLPVEQALVLPHADIVPDSLILMAGADEAVLKPIRDYFLNAAEGRILLTPSAMDWLANTPGATIEASYAVSAFAAETVPPDAVRGESWADAAASRRVAPPSPKEETPFGSALRRLFGGG